MKTNKWIVGALGMVTVSLIAAFASAAHVDGKNFKIETIAEPCKAGQECLVKVRLEPAGDYHINKAYPYKFKAAEVAGVEFLGKDTAGKNVFSRPGGDFVEQGEKVGTMTVRFKPSAKGAVTIAGTYKLSVCSAQNCQLDTQEVSFPVLVK